MPVQFRHLPVLVAAATAAITLAACTSPSASGSAADPATSAAAASSPVSSSPQDQAAAGSVADGIGHPVKVCALLSVARVAKMASEPLTVAKEGDTPSYKLYTCDYSNAADTTGLTVSVLALDAAPGYSGSLSAAGQGAHQISGLGDKAFSAITGVEALFGNVSITVSNLSSDSAAENIIRTLQPKI